MERKQEPTQEGGEQEVQDQKKQFKSNEIVIDVKVDTSELDVFIEKLKEANSLADELASKNKRQGKTILSL